MRIGVTRLPATANARRAEIDVLGVVLVVEPRRKQANHVHARQATVLAQLRNARLLAFLFRNELDQLRHDMAQLVDLALARDVARYATGILNVLVAIQDLPDRFRLGP